MRSLLIGVDIGTQGTKALLFDAEGRCLASSFEKSCLHRPAPGAVEEDPERQAASACRTIRRCMKDSGAIPADVAGVGMAGQMAGVIGVGRDGLNVTPYDSWLDTRCGPYVRQMDAVADEVVTKAGNAPSFNHGPKKLWWKRERPGAYRRTAAFVQPAAYAAMRLCGLSGVEAFIDDTYLHFSGFADNPRRTWNLGLCRKMGLDPAKLPRIVRPHDVVGELTARMAARCGLKSGVPVVAGCGDTAASFLACGATAEGICVDVAGTASVFAATTGAFVPDRRARVLGVGRSATPGLWHPYAYINGGGMNLEWFRRRVANAGGVRRGGGPDFEALDRMAAVGRTDGGPLFIPHLGGRVSPPRPDLRGAWVGVTWDHGIGDLYRALLEGVALEYAIYRRVLVSLYPAIQLKELRVTGGGERSAAWNRIKADTLGMTVRRIARSYGAPMGAALVAGHGVGLLPSLPRAASAWIRLGGAVRPDRRRAALAGRRVAQYERALGLLESLRA